MKLVSRNIVAVSLAASVAFSPLYAQSNAVSLASKFEVEKSEVDALGKETVKLLPPEKTQVVPGDKLIFTLSYTNNGAEPAQNFVAVNPLHSAVQFTSTEESWADVSVDGGKTFGKLSALTVAVPATPEAAATVRPATAEDVTTIRWAFAQPIPAGGKGTLSFRGVVK